MSEEEIPVQDEKLVEIIDMIEGYAYPITTPFGKVLTLSADLLTNGRPLRSIEKNLQRYIRAYCGYIETRLTIAEKARAHAKKSVAGYLKLNELIHHVMFFPAGTPQEPYRKITSLFLDALTKEKIGAKMQVYLQNNQSYVNVLPWLINPEKIRVVNLEADDGGRFNINTIINTVTKHSQKSRFNVIQLQSISTKIKQKLDLQSFQSQIENLRAENPTKDFTCVLDATSLIGGFGYTPKEMEEAFKFFDFSVIQTNMLIGGSLAANILICKKEKLEQLQANMLNVDSTDDVEATTVLRAAQIFEFYQTYEIAQKMESSQNSQIFFEEVQLINERLRETSVLNKIDLGGMKSPAPGGKYSIMILNEASSDFLEDEFKGYPVILAKHLSQFLHDLFGIQVKANTMIKSPHNFRFSDISLGIIQKYQLTPELGYIEQNASTIELDIHFLLTQNEVLFIANALEQIALGAGKLLRYYNKKLLKPKMYTPQQIDVSFSTCSSFAFEETDISNREEQYETQLYESSRILKQPANYFTISENWMYDKSIVFPLNALADAFPLKARKQTTVSGDLDEESDGPAPIQDNKYKKIINPINPKSVQDAKDLILQIQTYGIESLKPVDQGQPEPKVQINNKEEKEEKKEEEEEEEEEKISEELMELLRKQIRLEMKDELREEIEHEIKQKEEAAAAALAAAKGKADKIQMNEQISIKEKRLKNLKIIFNFYSSLKDVVEIAVDKDVHVNKYAAPSFLKKETQDAPKTMSMNKFFKFCDDFELINEQLDIKTLYKLFKKQYKNGKAINSKFTTNSSKSIVMPSTIPLTTAKTNNSNKNIMRSLFENPEEDLLSLAYPGDLVFSQFQLIVDKMAQVFFAKNDYLYTQFDKVDQFHKHLGLDEYKKFKPLMKVEGLIKFSQNTYSYHVRNSSDLPQSIVNKSKVNQNQNNLSLPTQKLLTLHNISIDQDYDSKSTNQQPSSNTKLNHILSQVKKQPEGMPTHKAMASRPSISLITQKSTRKPEVEWKPDSESMNPKLLYNDFQISRTEIMAELSQLSKQGKKKIPTRISSLPPQKDLKVLKTDEDDNNPLQNYSKIENKESKQNLHNLQTNQQLEQDYLSKINSPSNIQAGIFKQQVMSRAKQVAIFEKDKEQIRMRTLENNSQPQNIQKIDQSMLYSKVQNKINNENPQMLQPLVLHNPAIFQNGNKKQMPLNEKQNK